MLGKGQSKATDSPEVNTGMSTIICCSNRVSCTDRPGPENQRRPSFSWSYQLHRGRLLSENATSRSAIWAWSACLISCVTGSPGLTWLPRQRSTLGSAADALPFRLNSSKPPHNIVATHPLELVHLNYLCLEPWKGPDENVLVVTDLLTRYTQAYVTRTQTAQP